MVYSFFVVFFARGFFAGRFVGPFSALAAIS
jgi:hypothetical protein